MRTSQHRIFFLTEHLFQSVHSRIFNNYFKIISFSVYIHCSFITALGCHDNRLKQQVSLTFHNNLQGSGVFNPLFPKICISSYFKNIKLSTLLSQEKNYSVKLEVIKVEIVSETTINRKLQEKQKRKNAEMLFLSFFFFLS